MQTGCRSGRVPRKEKHPSDQRPVLHVDTDGWEGGAVWGGGGGGRRERPADSSGRVEGEVSAVRKKADHFRCLAEVTGGQLCQTLRVLLTT